MKKKLMFRLMILLVVLVLILSACSVPVMEDANGNPTASGLAIRAGLEILTYLSITAVSLGATFLTAKIGKKNNLQNVKLAIGVLEELARQTAGEFKQTIVDDLKANQGGKLTEEQKDELKAELLGLVLKKADTHTVGVLQAAGADINAIIMGAAEDWPLDMLVDFCKINAIPCDGCQSREDYINAIVNGGAREEKPPSAAAE